ncbi:MAG: chemotaxis protein CheD [Gammaproteobacteria bacterium]|nr:chemotaxis protein CheD [Gammaproteobacteria bacterium]
MNAAMQQPTEILEINLSPGEFYFGGGHTRIHTLLGSCIAITMWHPQRRIGGMCHYLLPSRGGNQRLTQGYYADEVVNLFLNEIRKTGSRPGEYEVKVFGGGNMFDSRDEAATRTNVSQNNIAAGCQLLKQHGFKVKAKDLGGACYRKIFLEVWNGDVWVQRGNNKPGASKPL